VNPPCNLPCCKESREGRSPIIVNLNTPYEKVGGGRDEKGSILERKFRFLEEIKGILSPLLRWSLGEIKIDIPFLRSLMEGNGDSIPFCDDGSVEISSEAKFFKKILPLLIK
jgi:hypothetical protein